MYRYLLPCITLLCHFATLPTLMAQAPSDPTNKPLLVNIKCSKCHTLRRVFVMPRPAEEWRDLVEKMRDKNPEWINPEEAKQIFSEIVDGWPERVRAAARERKEYEDARFLFVDRCATCHSVNRMLLTDKTPTEWLGTVERMRFEDPEYITEEDAKRIAKFLSEMGEVLKEDAGGSIFVTKCIICHPGERILLETHDRAGWEEIVKDMQDIASNRLPAARFGHLEASMVVDLLVKTQGPKTGGSSP